MSSNSPIHYIGGKFILKDKILPLIPEHDTFIDVFGGGGHIVYNKDCKSNKINIYNDINSDMTNLFLQIRDNTENVCKYLEMTLYSSEFHKECYSVYLNKDMFNKKSDLEKAAIIYFLIMSSFNGIIKKQGISSFSSGASKANAFYESIQKIRSLYKNVVIENKDFRDVILKYDSPTTVFYCDPPYFGTEDLYTSRFTEKDHIDLFEMLKTIKGKFILSYYHCKITELYKTNNFIFSEHKVKNSFGNERTELLITNFEQVLKSNSKSLFDF